MMAFSLPAAALMALPLADQGATAGLVRRVLSTYHERLIQVTVTGWGPHQQGDRSTQRAPNGEFRLASLPVGHFSPLDPATAVADLSDSTLEDPPTGRDRGSAPTPLPHAKESVHGSPRRRGASTRPAAGWIRAPPPGSVARVRLCRPDSLRAR
jgi:hypothetical protein